MEIRRWLIVVSAITLQVASWFDIRGAVAAVLNIQQPPMTAFQAAQLVSSGVLVMLYIAIKPKTKEINNDGQN